MKTRAEKPRITLASQVIIALLLGIATGVFFGEIVAPLEIVGDIRESHTNIPFI